MSSTLIESLADFACETKFSALPDDVISESKRIILDSIGCAVAAVDEIKGRAGIQTGLALGGGSDEATILGTPERSTVFGAAFANGELINTLDFDAVLPPGHVTPYVLPGALAVAESLHADGKQLIEAVAVAHEISYRIGKAMDYLRDMRDGVVVPPPVYGYSSTVFGATSAIAMLKQQSRSTHAHALGIAGLITPAHSFMSWTNHAPVSTVKYLMAGPLTQAALTAAYSAEFGHRGDLLVLDDRERGFPRFIGTARWEPDTIATDLGSEWRFPAEAAFKPYPHCRVMHTLFDALTAIVTDNAIAPDEIEEINAWGEAFVVGLPMWANNRIELPHDGQFSVAHGLAVAAHVVERGREWQRPELVFGPSVMNLMERVNYRAHPDYAAALAGHPSRRESRVEVVARGTSFTAEGSYPKGVRSPDPESYMTDEELVAKFRVNTEWALGGDLASDLADAIMNIEQAADVGALLSRAATVSVAA